MTDWPCYVGWFMRRRMVPARTRTDMADIYRAFLAWWADPTWWDERFTETPSPAQFAHAMACLATRNRLRLELDAGRVYCIGARLSG